VMALVADTNDFIIAISTLLCYDVGMDSCAGVFLRQQGCCCCRISELKQFEYCVVDFRRMPP
jgi:hypothetical protein